MEKYEIRSILTGNFFKLMYVFFNSNIYKNSNI